MTRKDLWLTWRKSRRCRCGETDPATIATVSTKRRRRRNCIQITRTSSTWSGNIRVASNYIEGRCVSFVRQCMACNVDVMCVLRWDEEFYADDVRWYWLIVLIIVPFPWTYSILAFRLSAIWLDSAVIAAKNTKNWSPFTTPPSTTKAPFSYVWTSSNKSTPAFMNGATSSNVAG